MIVHPFLKTRVDRKLEDRQKGGVEFGSCKRDGERQDFGGGRGSQKGEAGPIEMSFADSVHF